MTRPLTIETTIRFDVRHRGRKRISADSAPVPPIHPAGRIPRISRLMALAIRFEGLIRTGIVADQAGLARLGHVTRARVTQIMNLLHLAPEIQEALLFLERIDQGRDSIVLRDVLPIAAIFDWRRQRQDWKKLLSTSAIRTEVKR